MWLAQQNIERKHWEPKGGSRRTSRRDFHRFPQGEAFAYFSLFVITLAPGLTTHPDRLLLIMIGGGSERAGGVSFTVVGNRHFSQFWEVSIQCSENDRPGSEDLLDLF